MDINELLKIKPENDTLKKMQHSKWATSNNLFDYNSFINDFYALIEEFNSYKDRTEPDKQSESQEVKLLDYFNVTKLYLPNRILSQILSLSYDYCTYFVFVQYLFSRQRKIQTQFQAKKLCKTYFKTS